MEFKRIRNQWRTIKVGNRSFRFYFDKNGRAYHADRNYVGTTGIVVKKIGIQGWYLCYVNSAKSLNYSMYVMSRTTNYVLMLFVIVVILLLWIAYRMMVKNNEEMEKLAYTDQLTGAVSFARFTQLVPLKIMIIHWYL